MACAQAKCLAGHSTQTQRNGEQMQLGVPLLCLTISHEMVLLGGLPAIPAIALLEGRKLGQLLITEAQVECSLGT